MRLRVDTTDSSERPVRILTYIEFFCFDFDRLVLKLVSIFGGWVEGRLKNMSQERYSTN